MRSLEEAREQRPYIINVIVQFTLKANETLFVYMKVHELAKLLKHGSFAFTILTHTFHLHYCFTAF